MSGARRPIQHAPKVGPIAWVPASFWLAVEFCPPWAARPLGMSAGLTALLAVLL